MADLLAKTACAGLLPLTHGALTLTEAAPASITAILPYQDGAGLNDAMMTAHGVRFPAPGTIHLAGQVQAVWTGLDQAFLIGADPDASLAEHAALVDQTDAWAVLRLEGLGAADALARLTPLDLRDTAFVQDQVRRSVLGHMSAIILRGAQDSFTVMVFRSMAATAVHDLGTAMKGIAARLAQAD